MSKTQRGSRLTFDVKEISAGQVVDVLAGSLERLADAGRTLTPDDLREWAARLRAEAGRSHTLQVKDGVVGGS